MFFLTPKQSTAVQEKTPWCSTPVPLRLILSSQTFLCCVLQYHVSLSEISVSNSFSCHLLRWCYSVNDSIRCPLHLKMSIFPENTNYCSFQTSELESAVLQNPFFPYFKTLTEINTLFFPEDRQSQCKGHIKCCAAASVT